MNPENMPEEKPFQTLYAVEETPVVPATVPRFDRSNRFKATNLFQSIRFAFEGIQYAYESQRNFRIDIWIMCLAICLGCFLQISLLEWISICLAITFVLMAELANTALEAVVDIAIGTHYSMPAKRAKDSAAAACLIGAAGSLAIGLLIFVPKLWQLFVK